MFLVICGKSTLELCSRLAAVGSHIAVPCRMQSLSEAATSEMDVASFDLSRLFKLVFNNINLSLNDDDATNCPHLELPDSFQLSQKSPGQVYPARECIGGGMPSINAQAFASALKTTHRTGMTLNPTLSQKLDILVPSENQRYTSTNIARHTYAGSPSDIPLFSLGEDIYTVSPEFALMQTVIGLPVDAALALAYEACGLYGKDASRRGFYNRPALTSVSRIKTFASQNRGRRGSARMLRMIPYLFNKSRSPMETSIAIIMCLPVRLGGFGLNDFELNAEIPLNEEQRRMSGLDHAEIDFYFESNNLGLEYNSNLAHTGAARIARDSRRNNTLRYMGLKIITITWEDVRSVQAFEDLMKQTYKVLGKRWRPISDSTAEKRKQLWKNLIPQHPGSRAEADLGVHW